MNTTALVSDRFSSVLGSRGRGTTQDPQDTFRRTSWVPSTVRPQLAAATHYKTGLRRAKVTTPVRRFNDQTTSFGPGNISAGTFNATVIRGIDDCVHTTGPDRREVGELRSWDIEHRGEEYPDDVLAAIAAHPAALFVGELFHHDRDGGKVHHGWVLTETDFRLYWATVGDHADSRAIVETCAPYFCRHPYGPAGHQPRPKPE